MASPSVSGWDAFWTTVEHPINSIEGAATETHDILNTGGNVGDVLNTAWSGQEPSTQLRSIASQTAQNVKDAGGSDADAQAAYNEVMAYGMAQGVSDGAIGTSVSNAWSAVKNAAPSAASLKEAGVGLIIVLGLIAWILHEA